MKTIVSLLVAFSSLFSFSAYSSEGKEIDLLLGLGSVHAQQRKDGQPWNQRNNGVAAQYIFPGTVWGQDVEYCVTAGQVKNSEFGQSRYIGGCVRKTILEGSLGKISFGAFAGAMTYPSKYNSERRPSKLFPVVLPVASACLGNGVCVDATFIPKVQKNGGSAAVLFMLRIPIVR
ncbi:MAG: hypothetical protein ACYC75_03065 [Minisyncoccota bacterium]